MQFKNKFEKLKNKKSMYPNLLILGKNKKAKNIFKAIN